MSQAIEKKGLQKLEKNTGSGFHIALVGANAD